MLRKYLVAILLTAAISAALPSHAVIINANASMDGAQVVPGSGSTATGTALFIFDTVTGLLDLTATVNGIFLADITFGGGPLAFGILGPMHIHSAPAGVNGGIVVPFPAMAFYTPTATGMTIAAIGVAFNPAIIPALLTDGLYLQMHTLNVGGGGEIRGQLAVPEPVALTLLCFGLLGLTFTRRKKAV